MNPTDPNILEHAFDEELAALRKQGQFAEVSDTEVERLIELFRKLISAQPPTVDVLLEWFDKEFTPILVQTYLTGEEAQK